MRELIDKQILNIYLDSIPKIDASYSVADGPANPEGVPLKLFEVSNQRDKLATLIRSILKTFLIRFGNSKTYSFIGTNIFDPDESLLSSYKSLSSTLLQGRWEFPGVAGFGPKTYELTNNKPLVQLVPSLPPDFGSLYYLPVPLIIAMQILYYDKVIDLNERWPQFRFNTGLKSARADDNLLSAVNETHINVFSNVYAGYPITISGRRYYSQEEIEKRILFLQSQRTRIYSLERIFGPLALAAENYVSRAYRTGEDADSYLKKSGNTNTAITEFKDFFNLIYPAATKGYRETYNTTEAQRALQHTALGASLARTFPNEFSNDFGRNTTQWMRQRAWYERGRLLGQAESYDKSLLYEYMEGEDLSESDWLNLGEASSQAATKAVKNARQLAVDGNTWANVVSGSPYNDNVDINEFWRYLREGARYLMRQHGTVGWYGGGFLGSLTIILQGLFTLSPFGWVTFIVQWAMNGIDDWDKYLDPDEPDSLKYFRNPPSSIIEGEVITIDMQGSLIKAGNRLEKHKSQNGGPSTMDKIAMSLLYYELAWKSNDYKPLFDPESEDNEMEQLLNYIDIEDDQALESGFPVYLDSLFYNNTGRSSISMRPYFSLQALEDSLLELKMNPIYIQAEGYDTNDKAITRLFNEILSEISRAETADPDEDYYAGLRAEIYGTNAAVGPVDEFNGHRAKALFDLGDIIYDGASDLYTFISITRYADLLGSSGLTQDGYPSYRADMLDEVNTTTGYLIKPLRNEPHPEAASRTIINDAMKKIRTNSAQIIQLIDRQHLLYQEINDETRGGEVDYKVGDVYYSANPGRSAALVAAIAAAPGTFFKNRYPMKTWIDAINSDISALENAIRWRS